jgi:uncharacterized membrane protein YciS (DUF1049 family)
MAKFIVGIMDGETVDIILFFGTISAYHSPIILFVFAAGGAIGWFITDIMQIKKRSEKSV